MAPAPEPAKPRLVWPLLWLLAALAVALFAWLPVHEMAHCSIAWATGPGGDCTVTFYEPSLSGEHGAWAEWHGDVPLLHWGIWALNMAVTMLLLWPPIWAVLGCLIRRAQSRVTSPGGVDVPYCGYCLSADAEFPEHDWHGSSPSPSACLKSLRKRVLRLEIRAAHEGLLADASPEAVV